jgi:NTP pyrophosphatase (non-canonical NTP hydrolase)
MSDETKYKPALDWFAGEMANKLATPKNVAKLHWTRLPLNDLLYYLREETEELREALLKYENEPGEVISECCDVANFAMMIADWVNQRSIQKS